MSVGSIQQGNYYNPYASQSHIKKPNNDFADSIKKNISSSGGNPHDSQTEVRKESSTTSSAPSSPIEKGMLGRWAMVKTGINGFKVVSIKYSDNSTDEDPIMCTKDGLEVHINDINPNSATSLEMQMYCAHLDSTGQGSGGMFGTYKDLQNIKATAALNGMASNIDWSAVHDHDFHNTKIDWVQLTSSILDIVKENDSEQYNRYHKIFNTFTQ